MILLTETPSFREVDIVNPEDAAYADRLFVVIGHSVILGAAYADCLQDALDTLADNGNFDAYVNEDQNEGCMTLGNWGWQFDMKGTGVAEQLLQAA